MKVTSGQSTRQRLLEYIQDQRNATVVELSRALHMTPANARHHLKALQAQGLVETKNVKITSGKGRPARVFNPTTKVFEHNLDGLAGALLETTRLSTIPEEQDRFLRLVAARMAIPTIDDPGDASRAACPHNNKAPEDEASSSNPGAQKPARSLTQRLGETVLRLNALHYQARWEAHAEAPRVILGNCPYQAIVEDHPQICRIDAIMLEGLLGAPVQQIASLTKSKVGKPNCIFRLQKQGLTASAHHP